MARSDTTQDSQMAAVVVAMSVPHNSRVQRIRRRLGRCAAGISTCTLGITVAAMAAAQQQNIFEEPAKAQFQAAPKSAEAEAAEAAAASSMPEMILGIPVNTLFFVAAGVIAVFWFSFGGGRKAKINRN